MTMEQQITKIQETLPALMEEALMSGIKIGYEATMKVMEERCALVAESTGTAEEAEMTK
ncbi:hypothetical protein [Anaerotignum sp.]